MARALIVGCGCSGRGLGGALMDAGWLVRGTTRSADNIAAIELAGIEAVTADPDRVASVLDHVADVTVVCWLMGSATGDANGVAALHRERLERLLEELVDTHVRGFVYEAAGGVDPGHFENGTRIVMAAAERWRIPVRVVTRDRAGHTEWLAAMSAAVTDLIA